MKIKTIRNDGFESHNLCTREYSPEEGIYAILKYELGFGGTVVYLDEQKVIIKTPVLNKVDMVHIELESQEERNLMFTMLHHWYAVSEEVNEDEELMQKFFKQTGGVPLFVVKGLPLILGGEKVRRTLLACMGLGDKPEVVERLKGMEEKDIVALAELVREGGHTWEEALDANGSESTTS